jgi:MFS family permease
VTVLDEPAALPRRYFGWLGAASVSIFGDAVLYFALGWSATGIGPGWAGLVLTAINLPRAVLLLLGGAVGDRWGTRRVMIAGDAVMGGLTLLLALASYRWGVSGPLLVAVGLAIGVTGAFYLPATGSFPRLLVPDRQLPRALALRQSAGQVVALIGGPAGGALVAAGGLSVIAAVDAVSFAVVLAVLIGIRPQYPAPRPPAGTSVVREAAAGLRLVLADPVLRTMLAATGVLAAFILPMPSLCLPLLVRGHGWNSSVAGITIGVAAAGGLAVSLLVARRGAFARPGLMIGIGPLVAAVGMAGIALATTPWAAFAAALVQGIGNGLFVAHLGPLVMARAARTHLARVQSVLVFVQSVPLLVANNVLAAVAGHAGAEAAAFVCAGGTALAGLVLVSRPPVRRAILPAS